MPAADVLPQSVHPYIAMMVAGFIIGTAGHLFRSRWLVVIGITLVFLATLLFPLALNIVGEDPSSPPGPVPPP